MGDASEELTAPSTATPSPVPQAKDGSAPSGPYFRLESVTSLTAPVDSAIAARAAQMRSGRVPQNQIFLSSQADGARWADDGTSAEEKFPIPDNPAAWARYGFLDTSLLLQATGHSPGGRRAASSGDGAGGAEARQDRDSSRTLVRVKTDPGESWRRAKTEEERAAVSGGGRERRHHPPAPETTTTDATTGISEAGASAGSRSNGDSSHKVGSSTPRTDAVTPLPEEGGRYSDAAEAGRSSGGGVAVATGALAAASNRQGSGPTTARGSSRGGLDSMAASMLAASTAAAAAVAAAAAKEEEETKEEELQALRWQEARQAAVSAATATSQEESNSKGGSKNRPNPRRTQQTIAEIERHKRNRAERLRAYGCQRTLYPRIVPGGTGESGTSSPEMDTEETQTEEWVNSLRISAAIRGESLMAACTQSFTEQRAASLLGDQQLEARASRTADVSQMEGPDGLLHCAVLKGDHALAARAAQFLVDKRGSNVNSRDDWGR
ncbi:unnamed protein product [Hapterophycus canaliculatus]